MQGKANEETKDGARLLNCEYCPELVDPDRDDWGPCFPCLVRGVAVVPVKHDECIGIDQGEPEGERGFCTWTRTGRWACKKCCEWGTECPELPSELEAQRNQLRATLQGGPQR